MNDLYLDFDKPETITRELNARQELTPDANILRKEAQEHLVFVYGTLKTGFSNSHFLRNAKYLGKAHTYKDQYQLYDTGPFPVAKEMGPGFNRIYGEAYAVTTDQMMRLDFLESNGYYYERKKELVTFVDQIIEHKKVVRFCWIYFGMENSFDYNGLQVVPLSNKVNPNALVWTPRK